MRHFSPETALFNSGHSQAVEILPGSGHARRPANGFLLNELLVRDQCQNTKRSEFYHYRSTGKRQIHVIEVPAGRPPVAHQLMNIERIRITDVQLLKAFIRKNPGASGRIYAPVRNRIAIDGVDVHPWLDLVLNR